MKVTAYKLLEKLRFIGVSTELIEDFKSVPKSWIMADRPPKQPFEIIILRDDLKKSKALYIWRILEKFETISKKLQERAKTHRLHFLMKEIYPRIPKPEPLKHYSCKRVHRSYWTVDFCRVQFTVAGPQKSSCLQVSECNNYLSGGQKKLFSI